MDFSEFLRRLGSEPLSDEPELRRARESSPEFEQAAVEAERFEAKLSNALKVPAPEDLASDLMSLTRYPVERNIRWRFALAASVLVAVGVAGLNWKINPGWETVEEYLVDHYRHDGVELLTRVNGSAAKDVQEILAEFNVEADTALAEIIGVIKYCPTPDGKGVHMVLNTENGPVTVIYMPETRVSDKQILAFDGVEAVLVELRSGSAAIIGANDQNVSDYYAVVHDSILPIPGSS